MKQTKRYLLKLLRWTGYVAGVIIAFVALVLLVINLISYNSLKDDIERLAAESGVRLEIRGRLDFSLLRQTSFLLEDLVIYESTADNAPVLASIGKVYLSSLPLGLLEGQIHIKEILVEEPKVYNHIYADGTDSFTRFMAAFPPSEKTDSTFDGVPRIDLRLGRLALTDGAFENIGPDSMLKVEELNLTASDIDLSRPGQIQFAGKASQTKGKETQFAVNTQFTLDFFFDQPAQKVSIRPLSWKTDVNYAGLEKYPVRLDLEADFALLDMLLEVQRLVIQADDDLQLDLQASAKLGAELQADAELSIVSPDLKPLLNAIGIDAIKSAVPLSVNLKGKATGSEYVVDSLSVTSGGTQLKIKDTSFVNDEHGLVHAQLKFNSTNLRALLKSLGVNALLAEPNIGLNLTADGNLRDKDFTVKLSGALDDLKINLDTRFINKAQDDYLVRSKLVAESPDIVQELRVVIPADYPTIVPLELIVEANAEVSGDNAILEKIGFTLNDNFRLYASGLVEGLKGDPTYDIKIDGSFKSVKRLMGILRPDLVFPRDSLEKLELALGVQGGKDGVEMKNFEFRSPNTSFDASAQVQFKPLAVKANIIGHRLNLNNLPVTVPVSQDRIKARRPIAADAVQSADEAEPASAPSEPSKPWVEFNSEGHALLSREKLKDLLGLPKISLQAKIDWQNLSYKKLKIEQIMLALDMAPEGEVKALLGVDSKQAGSIRLDALLDARKDTVAANAGLKVNFGYNGLSNPPILEEAPLDIGLALDTQLEARGQTLNELLQSLKMNADMNLGTMKVDQRLFPNGLKVNGRASIRASYPKISVALDGLGIDNSLPADNPEKFSAGLEKVRLDVSLENALKGRIAVNQALIDGLTAQVFSGKQGFLGLDSSTDTNAGGTEPAQTSSPAKPIPDKTTTKQGFQLAALVLSKIALHNVSLNFNDNSADSKAKLGLQSFAVPNASISLDGGPMLVNVPKISLSGLSTSYAMPDQSFGIKNVGLDIQNIKANLEDQVEVARLQLIIDDTQFINVAEPANGKITKTTLTLDDIGYNLKKSSLDLPRTALFVQGIDFASGRPAEAKVGENKFAMASGLKDINLMLGDLNFDLSKKKLVLSEFAVDVDGIFHNQETLQADIPKIKLRLDDLKTADKLKSFLGDQLTLNIPSVNYSGNSKTAASKLSGFNLGIGGMSYLTTKKAPQSNIAKNEKDVAKPDTTGDSPLGDILIDRIEIELDSATYSDLSSDLDVAISELAVELGKIGIFSREKRNALGDLSTALQKVSYRLPVQRQSADLADLSLKLSGAEFDQHRQTASLENLSLALDSANYSDQSSDIQVKNDAFSFVLAQAKVFGLDNPKAIQATLQSLALKNSDLELVTAEGGSVVEIKDTVLAIKVPTSLQDIDLKLGLNVRREDRKRGVETLYLESALSASAGFDLTTQEVRVDLKNDIKNIRGEFDKTPSLITLTLGGELDLEAGSLSGVRLALDSPDSLSAIINIDGENLFDKPKLAGQLTLNLVDANDFLVLAHQPLFNQPLRADIDMSFSADLKKNLMRVSTKQFSINDAHININVDSDYNSEDESVSANLTLNASDLRPVIDLVTRGKLITARKDALNSLSISGQADLAGQLAKLSQAEIQLDDSYIAIDAQRGLDTGKTKAKVTIANLNVDHYLPPRVKQEKKEPEKEQKTDEEPKPIEFSKEPIFTEDLKQTIKDLDIETELTLKDFTILDISMDSIHLEAITKNGLVQVKDFSLERDQGLLKVMVVLDLAAPDVAYDLKLDASHFELGYVINPFAETELFKGRLSGDNHLTTRGNSVHGIINSLNGDLDIRLHQGLINGFNIEYYACLGLSYISLSIMDDDVKWPESSSIDGISLAGKFRNGELELHDIFADFRLLQLLGRGETAILKNTFKANAYVNTIGEANASQCSGQEAFRDFTLKVNCDGLYYDFNAGTCAPDIANIGELFHRSLVVSNARYLKTIESETDILTGLFTTPLQKARIAIVKLFQSIGNTIHSIREL